MTLVHGDEASVPVDLTRRSDNHALEAGFLCRGQDVQCPEHVDGHDLANVDVRVRNPDECGEVEDDVDVGDEATDRLEITDVAAYDRKLIMLCRQQAVLAA